jgi:UDP-2-acetamido-2,6-beta-L-arabino-hexul-4-ose reductase
MMKILVTGSDGFIGKNLIAELRNPKDGEVYEFDKQNNPDDLEIFTKNCDIVFHLAGVNRPNDEKEFNEGNADFTRRLLESLKKNQNPSLIVFSSSTQAILDNPYGKSKQAAEKILFNYSQETGIPVIVFRLPNVFGKWCRPSYNSVIATFCYNIAHDLPIKINDPESVLTLIYIDDLVNAFMEIVKNISSHKGYELIDQLSSLYTISLKQLSTLLYSFRKTREDNSVPDLSNPLIKNLYATYLSYLPEDAFSYSLKMKTDNRGSFTEFLRTTDRGQVSVNISRPGIVKGNHWHHTKHEKFLVISGKGIIRFRKIGTKEIMEYPVNGEKLEVVEIPPGYSHNIENLSAVDMVTIMWASEPYDPEKPDTFFENV